MDKPKPLMSVSLENPGPLTTTKEESANSLAFTHAALSFFDVDKLSPKGPRKGADIGTPHDSTRGLGKFTTGPYTTNTISSGSWWCAAGGWPSPAQRATTEIFYVLSGHGCLTDTDGMQHYFGPGDTVVLPKGWSGRWDVLQDIHKVWFVHDHPEIEETSYPIRAKISHYNSASPNNLEYNGIRVDATHGSPATSSKSIYEVGPTEVGYWTCTPGSFPYVKKSYTEGFHVLEGVFFLTNEDGSSQRCVAGDTIVLPHGWSGQWDVIEPVKKVWVIV